MIQDRDTEIIESIYDALDRHDPAAALQLARQARREGPDDDPLLHFLTGVALLECDLAGQAAEELTAAVGIDPEDPEFRSTLSLALFRDCRFEDAGRECARALELDDGSPDAHHVRALVLEREGRLDHAERHFDHACRLDPERFPAPCRVSCEEFGRLLEAARTRLPEIFRNPLEQVPVIVEPVPSTELLMEESPPLDPELLGLFAGVPLDGRGPGSPGGELPARIYVFQRNLERFAADPEELAEQITITLYHELGHYLGMDEEELEELDFG